MPAAVYQVEADPIDGRRLGTTDAGDRIDLAAVWDELLKAPGVEIECSRHPGSWWPLERADVPPAELETWRCPSCAWAFRQGLAGRGGTPQF